MDSENPTGADNQQGSRQRRPYDVCLTPQRLHAELLATGAKGLEAYLHGALRDGTRSSLHGTHRIGQSDRVWLVTLGTILRLLGYRAWIYREGADRDYWVIETTARFLSVEFDATALGGTDEGLAYVRGYFDAEGRDAKVESSPALSAVLAEELEQPGESCPDPRELGDRLRSDPQSERRG